MQISQHQAESVRRSLRTLEGDPGALSERFFEDLYRQVPDLQTVFEEAATNDLGEMIIKAVAIAVEDIDSFDLLRPLTEHFGWILKRAGVDPESFDLAVGSFVRAASASTEGGLDEETETNWRLVLGLMTTAMKNGAAKSPGRIREGHQSSAVFDGAAGKACSSEKYLNDDPGKYTGEGSSGQASTPDEATSVAMSADAGVESINPGLGRRDTCAAFNRGEFTPISLPQTITVQYVGDGSGHGMPLQTVLDVSLGNGIAHTHVCGGVAKCSTCRIRIVDGVENCLPRNAAERKIADAKGFPAELRLACQTRIVGPVTVRRLVRDAIDARAAVGKQIERVGRELPLAVMFADIRGFTRFSEVNFAYDVVHALNRYFDVVGKAIDANHGYIDKYIGDGVMALFGLEPQRSSNACSDAVGAALSAIENLESVNKYLSVELNEQFQIAIGINYGDVIVGEIGFSDRRQFTAIGDTVNTAARLEAEAKARDATLLISESTWSPLPDETKALGRQVRLTLRGKRDTAIAYDMSPEQPATIHVADDKGHL